MEEGEEGKIRTWGVLPTPFMTLGRLQPFHVLQPSHPSLPDRPPPNPSYFLCKCGRICKHDHATLGRGLGKGTRRMNEEDGEGWAERFQAALV